MEVTEGLFSWLVITEEYLRKSTKENPLVPLRFIQGNKTHIKLTTDTKIRTETSFYQESWLRNQCSPQGSCFKRLWTKCSSYGKSPEKQLRSIKGSCIFPPLWMSCNDYYGRAPSTNMEMSWWDTRSTSFNSKGSHTKFDVCNKKKYLTSPGRGSRRPIRV